MKLAKKAGIAVGTAIFFLTVSAKASSAATIVLLNKSTPDSSGDVTFTYGIDYSSANESSNLEDIGTGSTWTFLNSVGGSPVSLDATSATVITGSASVTTTNNPFGTVTSDVSGVVNSTQPAIEFTIVAPAGYQEVLADYSINEMYNGNLINPPFTGTVYVPGTDDGTNDTSVPEPLPVGGSFVAFGFGWWMKRRQAAAQKID